MNKYVVVIGASNVDIFADIEEVRLHDSNIGHISTSIGGVGRNIAENIALLGMDVKLISLIGNDIYGKKVLEDTEKVDMSYILKVDASTGVYLSVGREMLVAVNDMQINEHMTIEHIKHNHKLLENAEILVLDTNYSEDVLDYITTTYSHKKMILDPVSGVKCKKVSSFIGRFHTIKPNKMEAEIISGISIEEDNDLIKASNYFHLQGVEQVFITLGERGVFYSNMEDNNLLEVDAIIPKNVTGAGDAFVAALVYGLLNEYSIRDTAILSTNASKVALQSEETINKELTIDLIEVK